MQGNLPPEAQEKIEELQGLQETAQTVAVQKQEAESGLQQAEMALEELDEIDADTTMFRQIGDLYVETEFDEAESELEEKVSTLEIRLETLEKQEERVQQQFESLQEDLEGLLGGGAVGGPAGPGGPGAGGA
ncbi:prefoldin subunit beta [Halovivax gelatinilyticus]|uniref:prefoldin subunit beta n=1 Tax=Halovivax gelatinilyticus TaxID=2961597 RepID=UPI0020CA88CA|nr:prefoldin subunit beta [Halovivax gelatinilyticus]